MQKETIPVITNLRRIELVYQAVITLEAQTWAMRDSQQPLNVALKVLEAVAKGIHEKYSNNLQGCSNEN